MGIPIPFSRLMVVLLVGGVSACTTTNDVERLDHTVTRKLDALTATMKEELRDLKSIQRAQDKRPSRWCPTGHLSIERHGHDGTTQTRRRFASGPESPE